MPYAPPVHKRKTIGKVHGQRSATERQRDRYYSTGSKAWKTIRRAILARDAYTCQYCGRFGDQVDHKFGDTADNLPEHLQTLCASCHGRKTLTETLHKSI